MAGQGDFDSTTNSHVDFTDAGGNRFRLGTLLKDGVHSVNIHDADVHNYIINKYVHQHTAVSTTLAVATSGDGSEYSITVADATGFAVGNHLHIDTTSLETTHPVILAIVGNVFTLDRRIDRVHVVGDAVTKAIVNMASQDGTLAAPQEYFAAPEAGVIWHITRVLFELTHTTASDLGKFGDLAPLTNGVVMRAKVNGQYGTLTNWKTSADMKTDMFDVVFDQRSTGGGTYGTSGRGTFAETGAVLRLDGDENDAFEIYIQDDLLTQGLLTFSMKVQGHLEE